MKSISPQDVRGRHERGEKFVLVDCREADELKVARIEGALHLPLSEFPQRVEPLDRDADYVIFCHHGVRSLRAAEFMLQQGFRTVASMSGGIEAWSLQVDPTVPRYG